MNELEQGIIKEGASQIIKSVSENISKFFPYLGVRKKAVNTLIKGVNESKESKESPPTGILLRGLNLAPFFV